MVGQTRAFCNTRTAGVGMTLCHKARRWHFPANKIQRCLCVNLECQAAHRPQSPNLPRLLRWSGKEYGVELLGFRLADLFPPGPKRRLAKKHLSTTDINNPKSIFCDFSPTVTRALWVFQLKSPSRMHALEQRMTALSKLFVLCSNLVKSGSAVPSRLML